MSQDLVRGEDPPDSPRDRKPEKPHGKSPRHHSGGASRTRAVKIADEKIYNFVNSKTVLITGGGGSIGSEICRQVAANNPKKLVLIDVYENNAYSIQQELIGKYGDKLNLEVYITTVCDYRKINSIFAAEKPDIVVHAAAHKHVPLMETVPDEAVKNNVFGTLNTARAAIKNKVGRMVLISTDKAVNPTNIMGATKACVRDDNTVREHSLEGYNVHGSQIRQRARLKRLRNSAVQEADRSPPRRYRYRPRDNPLLYDDIRGKPARSYRGSYG